MYACYVDEAGCTGTLPSAISNIQPVLVIAGILIEQSQLTHVTRRFLSLKAQFFPHLVRSNQLLDRILVEIKGSQLRKDVCNASRKARRRAVGFMDKVVELLEQYRVRLIGRVWVKPIGGPFDGRAVYTSSIQSLCAAFESFLGHEPAAGFMIADSRNKPGNAIVSHSVFTQKYKATGDAYPHLLEMPTFGHSENHAGLQWADFVCSSLLFPMATFSYCLGHLTSTHVRPQYRLLKERYGMRLSQMQYRYRDPSRWRGGIIVSDGLLHRSGGLLFA